MPESMNSNLGNWKACKQLCLYYQPFIVIYYFPIFESGERRVTHTGLTYDKKCGRIGGRGWVDPQGGGSLLLVVLGVLGTLNILFNMNICILLLSTIIRVSGEKLWIPTASAHLINVVLWVVVLITFAARTPGNLDNARIFTFSRLFKRGQKEERFFSTFQICESLYNFVPVKQPPPDKVHKTLFPLILDPILMFVWPRLLPFCHLEDLLCVTYLNSDSPNHLISYFYIFLA